MLCLSFYKWRCIYPGEQMILAPFLEKPALTEPQGVIFEKSQIVTKNHIWNRAVRDPDGYSTFPSLLHSSESVPGHSSRCPSITEVDSTVLMHAGHTQNEPQ